MKCNHESIAYVHPMLIHNHRMVDDPYRVDRRVWNVRWKTGSSLIDELLQEPTELVCTILQELHARKVIWIST